MMGLFALVLLPLFLLALRWVTVAYIFEIGVSAAPNLGLLPIEEWLFELFGAYLCALVVVLLLLALLIRLFAVLGRRMAGES